MKTFVFIAAFSLFVTHVKAQTAKVQPPTVEELKVSDSKGKIIDNFNEVLPTFKGGVPAFRTFIKKNFKFPPNSSGLHGLVVVTFCVETDGSLTGIIINKGLTPDVDKESIRVIHLSPRWIPSMQNGKPVRVKYSVPIRIPLE